MRHGRRTAFGGILNKLRLRDREQAIVYAYGHGLVRAQNAPVDYCHGQNGRRSIWRA